MTLDEAKKCIGKKVWQTYQAVEVIDLFRTRTVTGHVKVTVLQVRPETNRVQIKQPRGFTTWVSPKNLREKIYSK